MKNRKGFTIVELVIVIAVIAILAAVLIPTFSGVVQRASGSAALQEARAALTSVIAMSDQGQVTEGTAFLVGDDYKIFYRNSKLDEANEGVVDNTPAQIIFNSKYANYGTDKVTIISITEAGKKMIGKALYNKEDLEVAVTNEGETPTVTLTGTVDEQNINVVFKIAVSSDFSEKVIVVIPKIETP